MINSRVLGTGCVFFRLQLGLNFSVICRAFSLLYSVHDFAHLNSFELADDLKKKMSSSNNKCFTCTYCRHFVSKPYLCVNFALLIQTFGDAQNRRNMRNYCRGRI